MRKRMISCLLALCVSFSLTSCSAKELPAADGAGELSIQTPAFSDVSESAWYAGAVTYCHEQGLMDGTSSTAFSPDAPASRAVLVTALYRRAGSPAVSRDAGFTDIPAGAAYRSAAAWASEQGVASGYKDGRFGGDDPVTREQFAAMLWRAGGKPSPSAAEPFADQADISAYAVTASAWARGMEIINGKEGNRFAPKDQITRKEASVMLFRWMNPSGAQTVDSLEIELVIGERTFSAKLEDVPAARGLLAALPLEITMTELNGNEKYYNLSETLPTDAVKPGTISKGDLMLYGSNCLVLFYESFSSAYSYTRLGRLDDPDGLAQAVGNGNVKVTFRQPQESAASLA